MNSLELARWQFGFTTTFHFAIVGISIGLIFYVAAMKTRWHRTGDEKWLRLTRFYGKLMLLSFAIGVATGIMQTFQFGMNWSRFSSYVGDVFGAPLALEGLAAFFLESVFLGLWMFGWGRLPRRLHLACLWIVAAASLMSAYAILVANSWMQAPVGYELVDGRAHLTDIAAVLFNWTVALTVGHVVTGALLTGSVVVLAIAAWNLLRGRDVDAFGSVARAAVAVGLVTAIAAATFGHFQGVLALRQQPMKMAAAEALYETESPAGLSLFAIGGITANPEKLIFDIKVPGALSLINELSLTSTVYGINDLQAEAEAKHGPGNYVPVVGLIYWSFRTMVGSGTALIAIMAAGCWLLMRRRLIRSRRFLQLAVAAVALPLLAQAGGWLVREAGRQPWVVEGLLRTDVANSPHVGAWAIGLSLAGYLVFYGAIAYFSGRLIVRELHAGLPDSPPLAADGDRPERGHRSTADLALTY